MPVEGIETWDGFRGNVDANACRDLDPRSFAYGEPQSIADGACPGAHGLFREVACEQSEKLIPAEPSYDVGWAETGRNRAGRLLDDTVSCRVAECVVHKFEFVEINHEQGTGVALLHTLQVLFNVGDSRLPVEQAGKHVTRGPFSKSLELTPVVPFGRE